MAKRFEIVFEDPDVAAAELLEDKTPITCENFWAGIAEPWRQPIRHAGETGPELWCFVQEPAEYIPYENSEIFPNTGDILFYHYLQSPTRDGVWVYDIGIYYGRGCSKLRQGWIPGNLFARLASRDDVRTVLSMGGEMSVVLRRAGY